jgi:hypothetical protein
MAKKKEEREIKENEIDWWNDFGEGIYDCYELEENEDSENEE